MMRFLTAGESHGQCLTAIIEGLPAGLPIDIEKINIEMARRQQGYGRGTRMKIETDKAEIVSGMRFGVTLGNPLTLVITNRDWDNWTERMAVAGSPQGEKVTAPRPGHADLTGILKYDRHDVRDILERASARETAARVAVGAIAKQVLMSIGIEVAGYVVNIGGAASLLERPSLQEIIKHRSTSEVGCIDRQAEAAMKAVIDGAKAVGDTVGGIIEVVAEPVLPGLGSHVHWDRRLDTRLAAAMMSIPPIKGVEFGAGFAYATLLGSKAHDEIHYTTAQGYQRSSNQAGGVEGGMSNGEPIVIRAVMKPIPTLMKPLCSVDITTHERILASTERSDVCAVPAAAVVGEAMTAIVLAQAILEKFGNDAWNDVLAAVAHYRHRLSQS